MTDTLTKEQMKAMKDKEAVAAMKAAKTNMETALSRISTLENCVANLSSLVDDMVKHIPEGVICIR
jgi:Tfp pilus assembly protein PilN